MNTQKCLQQSEKIESTIRGIAWFENLLNTNLRTQRTYQNLGLAITNKTLSHNQEIYERAIKRLRMRLIRQINQLNFLISIK